jgi:hypothetical protein
VKTKKLEDTNVFIEKLGSYLRLSLIHSFSQINQNQFMNLKWACSSQVDQEEKDSFVVANKKLSSVIKSFRAANFLTKRRGKKMQKPSPFRFYLAKRWKKTYGLDEYKMLVG